MSSEVSGPELDGSAAGMAAATPRKEAAEKSVEERIVRGVR
jgi:hypothetical protein